MRDLSDAGRKAGDCDEGFGCVVKLVVGRPRLRAVAPNPRRHPRRANGIRRRQPRQPAAQYNYIVDLIHLFIRTCLQKILAIKIVA